MFAGFDYGTSYCSIGVWRGDGAALVPVEAGSTLIASTLYAPKPELDLEHDDDAVLDMTAQSFSALRFGQQAMDAYLADPTEGYFVKSPKSFLGAPGLNEVVKNRFISVVAAMMGNVKHHVDRFVGADVRRVVIGRPVNFQGTGGAAENQQALSMLVAAAREAGFDEVSFLFEPMAAAMEYETRIDEEQHVLVVDVGGGTTDCSFVRVGPARRGNENRDADVLGHTGERLGGNDYDQMLALEGVMPALGFGGELTNGFPIPNTYYVDAVSTNDVNAQQRFYSTRTAERLDVFVRDGCSPERVARLRALRNKRSSYRLLREVELAKIVLSNELSAQADLGFLEDSLSVMCTREQLKQGSERLLLHLQGLIDEVRKQAGVDPDIVYLTGGMAQSAVVRSHLDVVLGDISYVDSDHFASVTQGLTVWARKLYG